MKLAARARPFALGRVLALAARARIAPARPRSEPPWALSGPVPARPAAKARGARLTPTTPLRHPVLELRRERPDHGELGEAPLRPGSALAAAA
jgi:hypothetical protein